MTHGPRHGKTLLFIDDQQNALSGWCLYLQSQGYTVVGASSPQEGLELFGTRTFDAVILDYLMPEMDGANVAATMKRIKPDVAILMFSGSDGAPIACPDVDAFLTKGCSPARLLEHADLLLGIPLKHSA